MRVWGFDYWKSISQGDFFKVIKTINFNADFEKNVLLTVAPALFFKYERQFLMHYVQGDP